MTRFFFLFVIAISLFSACSGMDPEALSGAAGGQEEFSCPSGRTFEYDLRVEEGAAEVRVRDLQMDYEQEFHLTQGDLKKVKHCPWDGTVVQEVTVIPKTPSPSEPGMNEAIVSFYVHFNQIRVRSEELGADLTGEEYLALRVFGDEPVSFTLSAEPYQM